MISEKTLSAEYPCYTGGHSIVYHFQLTHAVLVKSCAKSVGVKWQDSHFCQYMFMTNTEYRMQILFIVGNLTKDH